MHPKTFLRFVGETKLHAILVPQSKKEWYFSPFFLLACFGFGTDILTVKSPFRVGCHSTLQNWTPNCTPGMGQESRSYRSREGEPDLLLKEGMGIHATPFYIFHQTRKAYSVPRCWWDVPRTTLFHATSWSSNRATFTGLSNFYYQWCLRINSLEEKNYDESILGLCIILVRTIMVRCSIILIVSLLLYAFIIFIEKWASLYRKVSPKI